jgi:hypothetical protein
MGVRQLRAMAIAIAFGLIAMSSNNESHGDPLAALTLGAFLSKLADQVDQIVMDARSSRNSVAMEAGREAALAISNARNAYSDSLDETIAKLDPEIKNTTDKLQTLVNDVSTGAIKTVDLATSRSLEIVTALPFSNKEPQVRAITPRFVVPSESVPIVISFEGNFPNSSEQGFEPYLQIAGKRYKAQNDNQHLNFNIPAGTVFHSNSADNAGRLQFAHVTLTVPWSKSTAYGLWHTRKEDHFDLIVGSLPISPGKIALIHTTTAQVPVPPKDFQSGPFHQASDRAAGNNDDKNHPYSVTPDTGWHVVRNTSIFKVFFAHGDWSQSFVSDDGNRVQYNVTTIHHGLTGGSSGSVDFRILFKETTTQAQVSTTTENIEIEWGKSKAITYDAGTWRIVYTSFDDKHYEFIGPDAANPFLEIRNDGGSTVVTTKDPATLHWP